MDFKTVKDVIEFAIRKEEASAQFYHDLAALMKDSTTRIIFEVLERNEMQHKSALEFELIKQGQVVSEDTYKVSDEPASYIELDEQAQSMTYTDALQLAIRKEHAAFQLFAELMVQTRDPQLRKMFFELAQEEMRHVLQFENEYNSIVPKKQ
ncbi:MAG: ferritin family protein [Sedimentisphaerales bacterium]|nr:ferritin family protein [Sedimentisphaerales bacterium]